MTHTEIVIFYSTLNQSSAASMALASYARARRRQDPGDGGGGGEMSQGCEDGSVMTQSSVSIKKRARQTAQRSPLQMMYLEYRIFKSLVGSALIFWR